MKKRFVADQATLFTGIGMGFTIAIQVISLSATDFAGVYPVITTVSRFCALVGSYLAIIGVLMIARIPWIEQAVGHDRLVTWHRKSAPYSLYFISLHVLLVVIGYAGSDQNVIGRTLWTMIRTYPWMLPATVGFLLLVLAGVSSYREFRARMTYETWWVLHLYTYLAIALSFMHQILTGAMFITNKLARYYWIALYLFVAFAILIWRVLIPLIRSIRHQLRVEKIVHEGPGIISIYIKGQNILKLNAVGGNFFSWRFITKNDWYQSHPYSLSAPPTNSHLRITVKGLGDHSKALENMKPGARVFIEGPYGIFTSKNAQVGRHVVLIGGGVGITPLRAIMEEFPNNTQIDVLFRASNDADLVLREELDFLAEKMSARVHYLVGSRKVHPMTQAYIEQLVPQFRDSEIYICGPEPLVSAVREAAIDAGIPKDRFHDEAFAFHGD
ncbi:MAG: ferredoxin reductase family protein [Actinobacteria bacterium]|nr:ferredoxin reductase family protein [Actinomycetota bacterium]